MDSAFLIVIGILAFSPLVVLSYLRRISLRTDFFFFVFYAEGLIYLHVAPIIWMRHVPAGLQGIYVTLSLWALLLYEIPFALIYLWIRTRKGHTAAVTSAPRPERALGLSIATLGLGLAFLYVCVSYNLLFTHIGSQGYDDLLVRLPLAAYVSFRFFGLAAPSAVILVAAYLRVSLKNSRYRRLIFWLILLAGLVFCAQRMMNSRMSLLVLLTILAGVMIMLAPSGKAFSMRQIGFLAVLVVLAAYAYRVTINARILYGQQGQLTLAVLDPMGVQNLGEANSPENQLAHRLNGIDFMAQMTPAAKTQGYAHGRAWRIPALILWNQFRLDRAANNPYLETSMDTAKRYLMVHYTTIRLDDYASCILTDTYGNFGIAGFLISAVAFGWIFGTVNRTIAEHRSPAGLALALMILPFVIVFEVGTWISLTQWVHVIPMLVLFTVFVPWRRVLVRVQHPGYARAKPSPVLLRQP